MAEALYPIGAILKFMGDVFLRIIDRRWDYGQGRYEYLLGGTGASDTQYKAAWFPEAEVEAKAIRV